MTARPRSSSCTTCRGIIGTSTGSGTGKRPTGPARAWASGPCPPAAGHRPQPGPGRCARPPHSPRPACIIHPICLTRPACLIPWPRARSAVRPITTSMWQRCCPNSSNVATMLSERGLRAGRPGAGGARARWRYVRYGRDTWARRSGKGIGNCARRSARTQRKAGARGGGAPTRGEGASGRGGGARLGQRGGTARRRPRARARARAAAEGPC